MNETPFGPQGTLIGKKLGDYELLELLTSGGMARIYKGIDVRLQRYAAVKVLMRELLDSDETLPERFQREARAVAQLDHPNIVTLFQTGEQDGYMFIAMRLIEGNDLADEITRLRRLGQMMEPKRALTILQQVADALDYAHARGIIHRDFKPSNVLLDSSDRAYLTDFGLALWQSKDKTMGTAFGTPRYIAPEQALASETAVPQSDIYAMAVVLYEILTGDMLFRADTPMQIALSHISEPPPLPRTINPNIPENVEAEVLKALSKDAKARHQTAGEFINAVKAAYAEHDGSAFHITPPPPRPPTESQSKHPSTIIIPDARTPISQRLEMPASPVPNRTGWWVAGALLAVMLVAAFMLLMNGQRDSEAQNQTATAAEAAIIAALSATPDVPPTDAPTNTAVLTVTPLPTDDGQATQAAQQAATDSAALLLLLTGEATEEVSATSTRRATVAPTLTNTRQPTATDEPTEAPTDEPTAEPSETATDAPTATDTRTPTLTRTPLPTNTRQPTLTNTRRPLATVQPSNTVQPSDTPQPSNTVTVRPTLVLSATQTNTSVPQSSPTPTQAPRILMLRYDIEFFVVRNTTSDDLDVSQLTFETDSSVQRLGGSLPLTSLTAGRCSVIQQVRRTFDPSAYDCPATVERMTQIPVENVFWRGTSGTFEVKLEGETLAECPVATRTRPQTCEILLP